MRTSFVYDNLSPPSNITQSQRIAQRMRNIANISKPVVDITLEGDAPHSYVHTFSTLDTAKGTVTIVAPHDTRFDDVEICFVGMTKTFVDKVGNVSAVNGRNEAFHPFLKLTQPVGDSQYPQPRVFEAGKTYTFPFTFVIPQNLLIQTCRHKTANSKLRDAHLQLPPSLGDAELAGTGSQLLSDMSPTMARISYSIKVRILRKRERDGKEVTVVDKMKKVRVIPATEEQPPVDVDGQDEEICLRKEKSIRKGIFKGKLGRLVMEAEQPKSFRLPPPNNEDKGPPTTMAIVKLRFEPVDSDVKPPRLGSLASKIKVVTYYAAIPRTDFPSKSKHLAYDSLQGVHVESATLSARNMASVQWQRHDPHMPWTSQTGAERRDSGVSTFDCPVGPAPSDKYSAENPYFTARLLVPISLPTNKCFVPTFHTCLVSRVYILDLSLNVTAASNAAGVGTSVTLKIPVQISSRSQHSTIEAVSPIPDEALAELEETRLADDFFTPRSIAPPSERYLCASTLHNGLIRAAQQQQQRHSVAGLPQQAPYLPHDESAPASPPEYSVYATRRSSAPFN